MSAIVLPGDIDLSRTEVEFAHMKKGRIHYDAGGRTSVIERRQQLDPPPFVDSKALWSRAVARFHALRSSGRARGVPFIVVTNIYREMGGGFR